MAILTGTCNGGTSYQTHHGTGHFYQPRALGSWGVGVPMRLRGSLGVYPRMAQPTPRTFSELEPAQDLGVALAEGDTP